MEHTWLVAANHAVYQRDEGIRVTSMNLPLDIWVLDDIADCPRMRNDRRHAMRAPPQSNDASSPNQCPPSPNDELRYVKSPEHCGG